MGMDIYGVEPTSEKGKYFRNNLWWWRPVAEYCLNEHPDIANECEHWHTNDGDGLSATSAKALGEALLSDVASGKADEFMAQYRKWQSEMPREKCDLCDSTGVRTDEVGRRMGMPERVLDDATAIALGRTHGWCNACSGEGYKDAWATNYPFSVENLQEFAEFCIASGGFQIC